MKRPNLTAILVAGCVAILLWIALTSDVLADIRYPVTLLNSRGRPWLNQTLVAKTSADSTVADTAYEVGGGLYYFQVDPDSGWTTDVYDLWRSTAIISGWRAVKIGSEPLAGTLDSTDVKDGSLSYPDLNLDEQIDSTDVAPGGIAYGDLNLDGGVDSSDVKDAGLAWGDVFVNGQIDSGDVGASALSYTDLNLDSRLDSSDAAPSGLSWTNLNVSGDTLRVPMRLRPESALGIGGLILFIDDSTIRKGLTVGIAPDGEDLSTALGSWVAKFVNKGRAHGVGNPPKGVVVTADSSYKRALETQKGHVILGEGLTDTLHVNAQPRFGNFCGLDSIAKDSDSTWIEYVGADSTDLIFVSPMGRGDPKGGPATGQLYVALRNGNGFAVESHEVQNVSWHFAWVLIEK